jgi:transposase-like protein
MKCMNCGYYFLPDAKHSHPKWKRKLAIKMYTNGMSMRAISRTLNIPLGTIFTWIKRYGNATRAQEEVGGS